MSQPQLTQGELQQVEQQLQTLRNELAKTLVGQQQLVNRMLAALLAGGHILLEGVPGLAKSLAVNSLASCLGLQFSRIQFTPDLLPADLTGTLIYNQQQASFQVRKGPVFANLVLADEINRAPAKVQSALLEAMQERQVTIGDNTFALPQPFMVLATQNPIDQEGTYSLPEAQMDRFLFRVHLDYPSELEELEVMRRMASTEPLPRLQQVMTGEQVLGLRRLINRVRVDEQLERYILRLVRATRDPQVVGKAALAGLIATGASPRGSISLNLAVRAHALLQGRHYALPEDAKTLAPDVLNHRVLTSYEADAQGLSSRQLVEQLLQAVTV
ncbi:MAG: MoxR family ATPase [Bacteroidetes bacterium]|nr:MoxR family ATPase [Bacteroidota bacterium]